MIESEQKPKRTKIDPADKFINSILKAEEQARKKAEKEALKNQRIEKKKLQLEQKALKEANKLKPKHEPTEEEIVKKYVNRVIKNQMYHGRVDETKFQGLQHDKTVSKNLWMDTEFYFSVVFQSRRQKYEFLEKWEKIHKALENEESLEPFMIVNGLRLAEALGIQLTQETTKDFPTGDIDMMPFILDDFIVGTENLK